jgi:hypothetical protein
MTPWKFMAQYYRPGVGEVVVSRPAGLQDVYKWLVNYHAQTKLVPSWASRPWLLSVLPSWALALNTGQPMPWQVSPGVNEMLKKLFAPIIPPQQTTTSTTTTQTTSVYQNRQPRYLIINNVEVEAPSSVLPNEKTTLLVTIYYAPLQTGVQIPSTKVTVIVNNDIIGSAEASLPLNQNTYSMSIPITTPSKPGTYTGIVQITTPIQQVTRKFTLTVQAPPPPPPLVKIGIERFTVVDGIQWLKDLFSIFQQ